MACSVIRTVVSLSGGLASADASSLQRGNASVARMFTRRRNYSLSASADKNLLDAIQSEIDCKSTNKHLLETLVAETPKDFPFKMEDNPRSYDLHLLRDHNGETIKVIVHKRSESSELIEFNVNVAKKNGALLRFACTASPPDGFTVDWVCMDYPEEDIDLRASYVISEFSENLQKGLYEYLEKRGINLTNTNLFYNYFATYRMTHWSERLKASWLKAFKKYFLL